MRIINHDWLRTGPGTVMPWSCPKAPSDVLIISSAKNMQQRAKTVMGNNICNVLSVKILYKKENILLVGTLSQRWPFEWFVWDGVSSSGWSECSVSHLSLLLKVRWEECSPDKWPQSAASPMSAPAQPGPAQDTWTQVPPFYCNFTFKGFPKSRRRASKCPSCLVVQAPLFNHSLNFFQPCLQFGNLWMQSIMNDGDKAKMNLKRVPPLNFSLSDISPRPKWWTPRWRSWRSSSRPGRQTGGGGCGTWPRSGGEWWSAGWRPGPWPPEMRCEMRDRY